MTKPTLTSMASLVLAPPDALTLELVDNSFVDVNNFVDVLEVVVVVIDVIIVDAFVVRTISKLQ